MRLIPAALVLLVLLASGAAAPAADWQPLFDGKTLRGWHVGVAP